MFKKKLGDAAALAELAFQRLPPPPAPPEETPEPEAAPPAEAAPPEEAAAPEEAAPPEEAPPLEQAAAPEVPAPSEEAPPPEQVAAPQAPAPAPAEEPPAATAKPGMFDPVEGITLEQYATVQARRAKLSGPDELEKLLAEFGMDEAKWKTVDEAFMGRMTDPSDPMATAAFATEYGKFFSAASETPEPSPPQSPQE